MVKTPETPKPAENEYEIVVQNDAGTTDTLSLSAADADWNPTEGRLTLLDAGAKPLGSFIRVIRWHKK